MRTQGNKKESYSASNNLLYRVENQQLWSSARAWLNMKCHRIHRRRRKKRKKSRSRRIRRMRCMHRVIKVKWKPQATWKLYLESDPHQCTLSSGGLSSLGPSVRQIVAAAKWRPEFVHVFVLFCSYSKCKI